MVQDTVLLIRHKASQNRVWFPFHSSYSFLTKQSLPSALGPKHPNNNNQKNPPKKTVKKTHSQTSEVRVNLQKESQY